MQCLETTVTLGIELSQITTACPKHRLLLPWQRASLERSLRATYVYGVRRSRTG